MTARAMHASEHTPIAIGSGSKMSKIAATKATNSRKRTLAEREKTVANPPTDLKWTLRDHKMESNLRLKELITLKEMISEWTNYVNASMNIIAGQEDIIQGFRNNADTTMQAAIDAEIKKLDYKNNSTNMEGGDYNDEDGNDEDDDVDSINDGATIPTPIKNNGKKRSKTTSSSATTPMNKKSGAKMGGAATTSTPNAPMKKVQDKKFWLAKPLANFMNKPIDKSYTSRTILTWFKTYLNNQNLLQSENSGRFEPNSELKKLLGKPRFTLGTEDNEYGYAIYNLMKYLDAYLEPCFEASGDKKTMGHQGRRSLRASANSTPLVESPLDLKYNTHETLV